MFRTFIQCAAFLQAAMSAVFLIKAGIGMSAKDMAELATMRWDCSSPVLKNLTQQRADTIVGFLLLLSSVVLQSLHWLLPFGIDDLGIDRKGVIIAFAAAIPIWIVARRLSCNLKRKWYTQAEDILKQRTSEREGISSVVPILRKVSKRHDGRSFIYWWDISPGFSDKINCYEAVEFEKEDTGEKFCVQTATLKEYLTEERRTSRGKGNWGIKVLKDREDELAFEPGNRNGKWLFLPVVWRKS